MSTAEFSNAGDFNKTVIEKLDSRSMFRILIENFNYYFFSHMQSVKLNKISAQEVMAHFFDFFHYYLSQRVETDVSKAYASYYVGITHPARAFEENEQHATIRLVHHVLFSSASRHQLRTEIC